MTATIELDDEVYAALEQQAQALGLPPATLARQLLQAQLTRMHRPQSESFQRNQAAFQKKLPELLQTRKGQFAAFYEGELVGFGQNRIALRKEMIAKYGCVNMLITEVTEAPRVLYIPYRQESR